MPVPGCSTKGNVGEIDITEEHAGDTAAPPLRFAPELAAAGEPDLSAHAVSAAPEEAGEPAWFGPALAASLAPLTRISCINFNLLAGDGRSVPFEVVPFADGTLPTDPPHNLPALVNIDIINGLTKPNINAYLNGYNIQLELPYTIEAGRRAVCIEIGCTAEF